LWEVRMQAELELLAKEQVGRILGRHPRTVARMAKDGQITAVRIGTRGDVRFRPQDVDAYISAHLVYADVAEVLEEAAT
jgi:excisionase family DNA binding protein